MTRKLFWQDPYLSEIETCITRVEGDIVTVAETIFYAFSGGQESDHGTIGNRRVLEARLHEREIFYRLESDHGLVPGEPVSVSFDK